MQKKIRKIMTGTLLAGTIGIASVVSTSFISNSEKNKIKINNDSSGSVKINNQNSNIFEGFTNTINNWIIDNKVNSEDLPDDFTSEIIRKQWFIKILNSIAKNNYGSFSEIKVSLENFFEEEVYSSTLQIDGNNFINTLDTEEKEKLISDYLASLNNSLKEYLDDDKNYPPLNESVDGIFNNTDVTQTDINKISQGFNAFYDSVKTNLNSTLKNQRDDLIKAQKVKDDVTLNNLSLDKIVSTKEVETTGFFLNNEDFQFNIENSEIKPTIKEIQINTGDNEINSGNQNSIGQSVILKFSLSLNNAIRENLQVVLGNEDKYFPSIKSFADKQLSLIKNDLEKKGSVVQKPETAQKNIDELNINDFNISNKSSISQYLLNSIEINPENNNELLLNFILSLDIPIVKNAYSKKINSKVNFLVKSQATTSKLSIITSEEETIIDNLNQNMQIDPYIKIKNTDPFINDSFVLLTEENQNDFSPSEIQSENEPDVQNGYFRGNISNSSYNFSVNRIESIDDDYGYLSINYSISKKSDSTIFKTYTRNIIGYRGITPITNAIKDFNNEKISQIEKLYPGKGSTIYNQEKISQLVNLTKIFLNQDKVFQENLTNFKKNSNNEVLFQKIYTTVKTKMDQFFSASLSSVDNDLANNLNQSITNQTDKVISDLKEQITNQGFDPASFDKVFNQITQESEALKDLINSGASLQDILNSQQLKDFTEIINKYSNLSPEELQNLIKTIPDIKRIITDTQKNILYAISGISGASILLLAGIVFRVNRKNGIKIRSSKGITITSLSIMAISVAILIFSIIQSLGGF